MKIRNLFVENFGAIKKLELNDLADMVVIAGPNGCGKTQIYNAIRLLKSTYGGYQPNEYQQWWGEFQIRLDGPRKDIERVFRDPKHPLRIRAEFEIEDREREYLRSNAQSIIQPHIWSQVAPGVHQNQIPGGTIAQLQRVHGAEVDRRCAEEISALNKALDKPLLHGELSVNPNLEYSVEPNSALELIFCIYEPERLGIIDYHGSYRNYSRESIGGINLNIKSSEERFRQHALYNWQNKYSNIKSELAASYVRDLIAREAEAQTVPTTSLTDTLKELFTTFFPGKTFSGPKPGPDGTLAFPVQLDSGAEHDIDDLSSGEKEVLFGYLRLRNNAPKNSVIMIDEPELHLNPALLRGFPQFYHRYIGRGLGNQIWLVTHSDALLREAVGQPGFSVFHMQPGESTEKSGNQIRKIEVGELLDRAIVDLVGDLATYRPGAKVVIFEGGGDADFDVRMTMALFPKFNESVNIISAGNRTKVESLHELLRKASDTGSLGTRFYSVVDRDSGTTECVANGYKWDRYHIENYLLEAQFIHKVLGDLNAVTNDLCSVEKIWLALRRCASETLDSLVRHELEINANRMLVSAIKTRSPRNISNIAESLRGVIEDSQNRIALKIDTDLTLDNLKKREESTRNRFNQYLKDEKWIENYRGRNILRLFVDHYVPQVKYEVFRDLILARMRDVSFQPSGMREAINSILND